MAGTAAATGAGGVTGPGAARDGHPDSFGELTNARRFDECRGRLRQLGLNMPLSLDAVPIVERLLFELMRTTESYQALRILADQLEKDKRALKADIAPLQQANKMLLERNNQLHADMIGQGDAMQKQKAQVLPELKGLERANRDLRFLNAELMRKLMVVESDVGSLRKKLETTMCKQLDRTRPIGPDRELHELVGRRQIFTMSAQPNPSGTIPSSAVPQATINVVQMFEARLEQLQRNEASFGDERKKLEASLHDMGERLVARDNEVLRLQRLVQETRGGKVFGLGGDDPGRNRDGGHNVGAFMDEDPQQLKYHVNFLSTQLHKAEEELSKRAKREDELIKLRDERTKHMTAIREANTRYKALFAQMQTLRTEAGDMKVRFEASQSSQDKAAKDYQDDLKAMKTELEKGTLVTNQELDAARARLREYDTEVLQLQEQVKKQNEERVALSEALKMEQAITKRMERLHERRMMQMQDNVHDEDQRESDDSDTGTGKGVGGDGQANQTHANGSDDQKRTSEMTTVDGKMRNVASLSVAELRHRVLALEDGKRQLEDSLRVFAEEKRSLEMAVISSGTSADHYGKQLRALENQKAEHEAVMAGVRAEHDTVSRRLAAAEAGRDDAMKTCKDATLARDTALGELRIAQQQLMQERQLTSQLQADRMREGGLRAEAEEHLKVLRDRADAAIEQQGADRELLARAKQSETELEGVKHELRVANDRCQSLNGRIVKLSGEVRDADRLRTGAMTEVERRTREVEGLTMSLQEAQNRSASTAMELGDMKIEHTALQAECKMLRSELDNALAAGGVHVNSLADARAREREMSAKLTKQEAELRAAQVDLSARERLAERQMTELMDRRAKGGELETTARTLTSQVDELRLALQAAELKSSETNDKMRVLRETLQVAQEEQAEAIRQRRGAVEGVEDARTRLRAAESSCRQLRDMVDRLSKTRDSLMDQLAGERTERREILAKLEKSGHENRELVEKLEALQRALHDSKLTIHEADADRAQLASECENVKRDLEDVKGREKQLDHKVEELESALELAAQEASEQRQMLEARDDDLEDAQQLCATLRSRCADSERSLHEANREVERTADECRCLVRNNQKLQAEVSAIAASRERAVVDKRGVEETLGAMKGSIKFQSAERGQLERIAVDLKSQLSMAEAVADQALADASSLRSSAAEREAQLDDVTRRLDDAQDGSRKLLIDIKTLERRLAASNADGSELRALVNDLEAREAELKRHLQRALNEVASLQQWVERLQRQLSDSEHGRTLGQIQNVRMESNLRQTEASLSEERALAAAAALSIREDFRKEVAGEGPNETQLAYFSGVSADAGQHVGYSVSGSSGATTTTTTTTSSSGTKSITTSSSHGSGRMSSGASVGFTSSEIGTAMGAIVEDRNRRMEQMELRRRRVEQTQMEAERRIADLAARQLGVAGAQGGSGDVTGLDGRGSDAVLAEARATAVAQAEEKWDTATGVGTVVAGAVDTLVSTAVEDTICGSGASRTESSGAGASDGAGSGSNSHSLAAVSESQSGVSSGHHSTAVSNHHSTSDGSHHSVASSRHSAIQSGSGVGSVSGEQSTHHSSSGGEEEHIAEEAVTESDDKEASEDDIAATHAIVGDADTVAASGVESAGSQGVSGDEGHVIQESSHQSSTPEPMSSHLALGSSQQSTDESVSGSGVESSRKTHASSASAASSQHVSHSGQSVHSSGSGHGSSRASGQQSTPPLLDSSADAVVQSPSSGGVSATDEVAALIAAGATSDSRGEGSSGANSGVHSSGSQHSGVHSSQSQHSGSVSEHSRVSDKSGIGNDSASGQTSRVSGGSGIGGTGTSPPPVGLANIVSDTLVSAVSIPALNLGMVGGKSALGGLSAGGAPGTAPGRAGGPPKSFRQPIRLLSARDRMESVADGEWSGITYRHETLVQEELSGIIDSRPSTTTATTSDYTTSQSEPPSVSQSEAPSGA